ncbi:hypothetical protein AVEN_142662-1 [Araneus ventricosus]|uniref:Uncharacterized protein n=1 Tax=Araneus ventricosus TaxID=182803 RepID=A0A4Y2K295_ARAVE|nr:hypothetical protein AVEN_142662-1 [Araneus ventricosus]
MYEKTPCDVTACRGEHLRAALGSECGLLIDCNDFGVSAAVRARKLVLQISLTITKVKERKVSITEKEYQRSHSGVWLTIAAPPKPYNRTTNHRETIRRRHIGFHHRAV